MDFMNALLKYHLLPSPESLQQLGCFILLLKAHNKYIYVLKGGSDSKESVCNAGVPGSTPGPERSPGEGNGYPL